MDSLSKYILSNGSGEPFVDENKVPLNGSYFGDNGTLLLRFINGFLDGDIFDADGNFLQQKPAVESLTAEGHQEYWRRGRLHRDDGLPAVIARGLSVREFWENGERIG